MRGTCIECPPQRVDGEDEPLILSFYNDVCQLPQVNEFAVTISQNTQRLLGSVTCHLNRWRHYRTLWKLDKAIMLEKFAVKKPSCVMYDEKLQFYLHISQEVVQQPLAKDEHIIRLNLEPLRRTVLENAQDWVTSLGRLLNDSAREELYALDNEFQVFNHDPFPPCLFLLSSGNAVHLHHIKIYKIYTILKKYSPFDCLILNV